MRIENIFKSEELVIMRHYDRKTGTWVETEYPKVGGRLRLAHEQNESLIITTKIVQYNGDVAVVQAECLTDKGNFSGLGMASIKRDAKLAPAILELSETRAIARALRFAGYGVEQCSAEEVSHLQHDYEKTSLPAQEKCSAGCGNEQLQLPENFLQDDEDENSRRKKMIIKSESKNCGNRRLSQKQHSYLLNLADSRGISRKELDKMSVKRYGCVVSYLKKQDASHFIKELNSY